VNTFIATIKNNETLTQYNNFHPWDVIIKKENKNSLSDHTEPMVIAIKAKTKIDRTT
jgi:hypothetical protein